jgi:uncharacterized protein (DUF2164 family)
MVRELLSSELSVSVGNMEIIPFSEKLYKMIWAYAYNEGLNDAKKLLERKLDDVSEQIDLLIQDESPRVN